MELRESTAAAAASAAAAAESAAATAMELRESTAATAMELHLLKESMPAFLSLPSVTPSMMSDDSKSFSTLHNRLGLNIPPLPTDFFVAEEGYTAVDLDFSFDWSWTSELRETDAYDPIVCALNAAGLCAVAVGNGNRLAQHKGLFDADLYSLRQTSSVSGPKQTVFFQCHIRGGTDIVVLYEEVASIILAHNVKFAIELKKDLRTNTSLKAGMREAVTELIGLCALNSRSTPPVLLSDLKSNHFVVRLVQNNGPPIYSTVIEKFESLKGALQRAIYVSELPCCTSKFARPPSPPSSTHEALDEEDSE